MSGLITRCEQDIMERLVTALLDAGFQLGVDDGGHELAIGATTDKAAILNALHNTDEDYLLVFRAPKPGRRRFGWVRLVYGNDGWDVICDYTTNLEPWLAPISEYADTLQ